jgi:glucose-6-phosphate 1-dehydrogenase
VAADSRIVLEKPIGHDLKSSQDVNSAVADCFDERNIYRIDHYLGKETVQNLLALRFANRMINSQWDNSCIDHIQITAAETVGIEGRWGYYDNVGQLRDMIQNHLLQLLCMVAMEPPNSLQADEIRAEKVKILRALSPITVDTVAHQAVRGQYTAGWINGKPVVGYMEEEGSERESSDTETFVALKTYIDNWRWAGVPFYLRTGKRMNSKVTEVVITYKDHPHAIFPDGTHGAHNRLIIRLQPNEGIELEMVSKKQSLKERMSLEKRTLNLDFFDSSGESRIADAYERLFLEVMKGDQWLFVSRDEIEASWHWCDTLLDAWHKKGLGVKGYSAGSWGPSKAEMLIEKDQRSWHES